VLYSTVAKPEEIFYTLLGGKLKIKVFLNHKNEAEYL
jgi:hypothetical protein